MLSRSLRHHEGMRRLSLVLLLCAALLAPAVAAAVTRVGGSGVLDAASWGPGHVSVFVRSVDNQIWETRYQGGWSPWAKSAPGDIVQGGPGAISRGTGQLDVFVWATDGSAHQYLPR